VVTLLFLAFFLFVCWGAFKLVRWGGQQDGGEGRRRGGRPPKNTPPGPPPLPKKWTPPDYIPEWVEAEQGVRLVKNA